MSRHREPPKDLRRLVLVLGDQLDRGSAAFDGFEPEADAAWMAEVHGEATHAWSSKPRIAMFFSAMRHFRDALREDGIAVDHHELSPGDHSSTLASRLRDSVERLRPKELVVVHPGEHRVLEALREAAGELDVPLAIRPDRHFLCSSDEFEEWAAGRKLLRLEDFYRRERRRHGVLVEEAGSGSKAKPTGGRWNLDAENRESFGKEGPGKLPAPVSFRPNETTREVLRLVEEAFPSHPGSLDAFDWPLTPGQAKRALTDFVKKRLPRFGAYQDAMWTDEPWLHHSRLSAAMNVKLLDPRRVISQVEEALARDDVPLRSVEGFIRQVLGWREYVRGIYWREMPGYLERNALRAQRDLPRLYWTAQTDMACLREVVSQTLELGHAHHVQRLMVTGLFALLLGVRPKQVHEWYLAVYVDAVEWVEAPNVIGMSQFADGGLLGSKPYCASGKYVQRMSNYCDGCRYDPSKATGDDACPFTTLYWDFLARHRERLKGNHRMAMQLRNVDRKDRAEMHAIRRRADEVANELE